MLINNISKAIILAALINGLSGFSVLRDNPRQKREVKVTDRSITSVMSSHPMPVSRLDLTTSGSSITVHQDQRITSSSSVDMTTVPWLSDWHDRNDRRIIHDNCTTCDDDDDHDHDHDDGSYHLHRGAKNHIVPHKLAFYIVGCVAVVAILIIIFGIIYMLKRNKQNRRSQSSTVLSLEGGEQEAYNPDTSVSTTASNQFLVIDETSSKPNHTEAKAAEHQDGASFAVGLDTFSFDSTGEQWIVPKSEVSLTVPAGAVPANKTYRVTRQVITDLEKFRHYIPQNEIFIAPIAEFSCSGTFEKHVKIDIPHCLPKISSKVFVRWGDTKKNVPFQDVPYYPQNDSNLPDIYYKLGPKYISVFTKHFTQFLCSEHYIPLQNNHRVQLESLLLCKQTVCDQEQELHFKLFILDRLYQIKDMRESLQDFHEDFPKQFKESIKHLPDTICSDTKVTITLSPRGPWMQQRKANGKVVTELKQTVPMNTFLGCQRSQYTLVDVAQFVLVSSQTAKCSNFQGDFEVSISDKPVQRNSSLLRRFLRIPGNEATTEPLEHKNSIWVNWVFGDPSNTQPKTQVFHSEEDIFEYISAQLPKESTNPLRRKLGLTQADWDHIQDRYNGDLKEQKYQMLLLHREKSGATFSIERLLGCLDNKGIAQHIRQYWKSIPKPVYNEE